MSDELSFQAQAETAAERAAIIDAYISKHLKEGIDYGAIPVRGRASKPGLFKPGAEKICLLLALRPVFTGDDATLNMAGNPTGLFAYVCQLVTRDGEIAGEGRGGAHRGRAQQPSDGQEPGAHALAGAAGGAQGCDDPRPVRREWHHGGRGAVGGH